ALRGGALTAGSYAVAQAARLAANLILARLLFPEAFGVMALVTVFLVGLAMFSDIGIGPAISQSARGDDPDFLNTAWTVNVIRGALLWVLSCAVAWPLAQVYDAPQLAQLLPAAGLTLLIAGFNPTRIDTANRHLALGRVTALDLISQIIGIVAMVVLAYAMRSVWALVIGAVIGSVAKLALTWWLVPGPVNRFSWAPAAARALIHFGKWIFLSTACGFLLAQGDKAIFGVYLSLEELGLYNIGFFLASFPILLGGAVTGRILLPLYRDHPPSASLANAAKMARLRYGISFGLIALLAILAIGGIALVHLLYDDRYNAAGAVVVAVACVQMVGVIGMTYDQSALAAGNARGYFLVIAAKAAMQTVALVAGMQWGGLGGALLAQVLALIAAHGFIVALARKHGAWDGRHDLVMGGLVALIAALAVWLHEDALRALLA
ncbi:MAG: oligosaccharide flippase family protein, partial [Paracoccaceae bacterium]